MSDKQVFIALIGGIAFAILGGLLIVPIQWATHAKDGGDDLGWGLLWFILMVVSGIVGFLITAKWARRRYPDFQP
jgi:hypothetical protein